jgi:putative membrane protein
MKGLSFLVLSLSFFFFSCGNGANSNSNAVDTTKSADTTRNSPVVSIGSRDSTFSVNAADAGMLEVELGKIAQSNSQNQKVKNFGSMMVRDHTKAGDELKTIAQTKHITLPSQLSPESQNKVDELRNKKGKDFDKSYMDLMVKGHTKVGAMFEDEIKNGSDADLKSFASNTLTTIQMHLDSAKKCEKMVK